jgi:dihydropteroate synthase
MIDAYFRNMLQRNPCTLNCRGRLLSLERTAVMGIINITPDSFYKSSRSSGAESALQVAEAMLSDEADLLDLGAQSTRPGAEMVDEETELKRLIPAVEAVHKHFPEAIISVDTFRARVAEQAVAAGASVINDISAGEDDTDMLATAGRLKTPYIAMHKKGLPATMQENPHYENVVNEVLDYFAARMALFQAHGIYDTIVDPGFGFGKTIAHNFALLARLEAFHILNRPLLVGVSRKSMIWKTLHIDAEQALNGTTVLHTAAILKGAHILRVHDVREARQAVQLCAALN